MFLGKCLVFRWPLKIVEFLNFVAQDLQICDAKGRDCIESISAGTFNCSTTCSGIYADVQWVGSDIIEEIKDDSEKLGNLEENVNNIPKRRISESTKDIQV